ncbi:tyrosine-type recombinase/integrase [Streptomyces sp. NBC_01023]|uniref:tyrosine-type recombinase/integrase n=1 Tax=Streptomyces sp. NBC_01023 TaxID=2903724 RepID=UPI00386618FE|nr:tyrosine-type recombinase/integrase [Streptomyces sp. NBC_01023]
MRQESGTAYIESGRVWTHENGEELHPDWISRRFALLVELPGLPAVRLHALRHLAATLALLAGHDIKVVQEKLGHSSRQITSDTYTAGARHRSPRPDHPRWPGTGRRRQRGREVDARSLRRERPGAGPGREPQRPVSRGTVDGLLAHALHGRPPRVCEPEWPGAANGPAADSHAGRPPGSERASEDGVRALPSPGRFRVPCASPGSWSERMNGGHHTGVVAPVLTFPQVETIRWGNFAVGRVGLEPTADGL